MSTSTTTPLPASILVVEDEGIIAADLAACLEDLGYRVVGQAASGEDALRLAAEHRPHLVLMDIVLEGEMDGIAAANRLRREQDTPVIFLTSHADTATLDRARESQPFGYLIKPFAESELRAAIEMSLYRHQAERRVRALERKLQEAQKLETIGVLAGGIAHDFNNLLAGISGNAELCQLKLPGDSPLHEHLEKIGVISHRAAELCQQMLAYAGKGKLQLVPLDLHALIADIQPLFSTMQLRLAADLPPVQGDRAQLGQVVRNLLLNAAEATCERPGEIRLTTGITHACRAVLATAVHASDLPEGQYVFLEVADTGCGMAADMMRKIFDPFFTTKFTGRGLGLAAVLGIVRGHRGALHVESAPDCGSTFRVLLPLACEEEPALPRGLPSTSRGSSRVSVMAAQN